MILFVWHLEWQYDIQLDIISVYAKHLTVSVAQVWFVI